tara:strand:+ start:599 stop:967 length:369 start_codon:yes stop_codon:yes gene_type:complete
MVNEKIQNEWREHALQRCRQRYKIALPDEVYEMLNLKIVRGEGDFIVGISNSKRVWKVEWDGQKFLVIYNRNMHQIITFLEMIDERWIRSNQGGFLRGSTKGNRERKQGIRPINVDGDSSTH